MAESMSGPSKGMAAAGSGLPPLAYESLLVGGVALFASALFAWLSLHGGPYGVATVGAERVLSGEVPYRDFWTMYAPGQFYLLASLFAVFGHDNLVSTLAGALLCGLSVGLSFRLIWKITGNPAYALVCAAVYTAAFLNGGYYGAVSSYSPVMFCLLLAYNLLHAYLTRGRAAFLFAAGLATGFGVLFKHDVGGYGALAMVAGLSVYHFAEGGAARLRAIARDLLVFSLGGACPVLPVMAALALVAGPDAWQDLIVFPATDFRFARLGAYPSLIPDGFYDPRLATRLQKLTTYVRFAMPFLVWLGSMSVILLAIGWRQAIVVAFGAAFVVVFLFHYVAAHVQINTHIVSMSFYGVCLGTLSLHLLASRFSQARAPWLKAFACLVAAGWFGALVAQPFYKRVVADLLNESNSESVPLRLAKVSQVRARPQIAAELRDLADFVQARVPPGQAIYIGPHRHDVVVTGRTGLYFPLDRPSATRYQELHPGIADTASVQAEIIRDLKQKDIQLLVLVRMFDDDWLDELKARKQRNLPRIGATDLDAFIQSNYAQVRQIGNYSLWLKKS